MRGFVWTACVMYAVNGLSTVIIGSVLAPLLAYYGTSYSAGGMLVFLQFMGFLVGVAFASLLSARIGHRATLVIASVLMGAAETLTGLLPSFWLVALLSLVNGMGLSVTQTTIASSIMEWFEGRRAVVMSRLEVAFGVGALVMPSIASLLIAHHMWRQGFIGIGITSLLFAVVWPFIPIRPETLSEQTGPGDAHTAASQTTSRGGKLVLLGLFLAMIFLYVGVESCFNSFLPSMFIPYLGQPASAASLAVAVFWTAMVIGRLMTGWAVRKVPYAQFLLWSIAATLVLIISLTLTRNSMFAYSAIFVLGLAMSGIFAITMVFANHSFPGQARLVTGCVTAFAGLGGAALPVLLGFLMDHLPVKGVLLSIAAFTAALLAALLAILWLEANSRRGMAQTVLSEPELP